VRVTAIFPDQSQVDAREPDARVAPMSYQVLARKWRPRRFAEMVGQEHVLKALINALDKQRLHHAFLFTGTRGVGKTTISRILAKSLNCEKGISSQPCGECGACQEVDQGRFMDLIEIDAASNNGVDDVRELIENAQYRPSRGAFKVYLIDEVHMLSKPAFNALLKTLEEPPEHAKFLLATTDPQKLPATVLSRCLQFGLKRLPQASIAKHLGHIMDKEGVPAEPAALDEIARAADGSMRDGLSLLDQAIAYGGGKLAVGEVRAMLGTVDRKRVYELLELLARDDAAGLLALVAELDEMAPDYEAMLGELAGVLQRVAIMKAVPAAASEWEDRERLAGPAAALDPAEVQLLYQISIMSRRDLPLALDMRSGFEMALLRMLAFRPEAAGSQADATGSGGARGASTARPVASSAPAVAATAPSPTAAVATAAPIAEAAPFGEWGALIERMALKSMVRELARNCVLVSHDDGLYKLALPPTHSALMTDSALQKLQEALNRAVGPAAKLRIEVGTTSGESPAAAADRAAAARVAAARSTLEHDPVVQALANEFGARLDPSSVRPGEE